MGGSKKISPAKSQKRQHDEAAKKDGTKSKKGKKDDKGEQKSKSVITVILTDEQAMKVIKGSKVITVQELARRTGVKISASNSYLIKSLQNGIVKKIAGHSGHYVYQPVST